jgi:hypothetical protein
VNIFGADTEAQLLPQAARVELRNVWISPEVLRRLENPARRNEGFATSPVDSIEGAITVLSVKFVSLGK